MKHIALLNTTIITGEGRFTCTRITTEIAKQLISEAPTVTSYIGHDATAKVMGDLLCLEVLPSRNQFAQTEAVDAICLKLRGRLPEGTVLSIPQLEEIGYDLFQISMKEL
jgi:hypothetical protein